MQTETMNMQQGAQRLADNLEATVRQIERLNALGNRGEDAGKQAYEELIERPAGISMSIVVDVELYGGGPAGGIRFECERGDYGVLDMLSCRAWHQDWFQPKGWSTVDDDTANFLFDAWCIESMGGNT